MASANGHILFVTSGAGMGHATRDIALYEVLHAEHPGLRFTFASYADGARAFALHGLETVDLGLGRWGKLFEAVPAVGGLLRGMAGDETTRPDLVVADEVLWALPLCKTFGLPSVYVTNWIENPRAQRDAQFMMNADHVILCDLPDTFVVPAWLDRPVSFVGPVCREMAFESISKQEIRQELGLDPDAPLVVATAGGGDDPDIWFFRTAALALSELEHVQGILVIGRMFHVYDFFQYTVSPNIRCTGHVAEHLRYLAASDVVLTRGGHSTLWELALLGVPSVCMPHPPDVDPLNERYAAAMAQRGMTVVLRERQTNAGLLRVAIRDLLEAEDGRAEIARKGVEFQTLDGRRAACEVILEHLGGTE